MEADHILAVRRGGDDGVARLIISRSPEWGDESLNGVPLNKLTVVCVPELAAAILRTFEFDAVELASDLDADDREHVAALCASRSAPTSPRRVSRGRPRSAPAH